jgi:hypothetical protein
MGPEDIRWQDNDSGIDPMAYLRSRASPGNGSRKPTSHSGPMPGPGRGRGFQKNASKKDFPSPQNGVAKSSDDIDILHTESLIKEVIVDSIYIHDYKELVQTLCICFY